jgi:steroid 5-alpha reductase family enzyme
MSWDRLPWIGAGIVAAAVISFVIGVVLVRQGKRTRAYLLEETLQDIGFVCLGVSFVFDKGTTPRVWFMAGFVLFFGVYVTRRIWRHAKGNTGDQPESE